MLPLRDENPHPPGFKPKLTIALIIINVIVFGIEVAITGQFIEFSNYEAMNMFLNWGAVPGCVTGQIDGINTGAEIINCPAIPELTLITSTFMHGGIMHLGGNMLFLWIFGDNIEAKFGRVKYIGIYLMWGVGAGLIHIYGDAGSGIQRWWHIPPPTSPSGQGRQWIALDLGSGHPRTGTSICAMSKNYRLDLVRGLRSVRPWHVGRRGCDYWRLQVK